MFLEISKFTGKHQCQSLFFNKFAGLSLWQRCLPVNFVKFLRTPFYIEHLCWLLLFIKQTKSKKVKNTKRVTKLNRLKMKMIISDNIKFSSKLTFTKTIEKNEIIYSTNQSSSSTKEIVNWLELTTVGAHNGPFIFF